MHTNINEMNRAMERIVYREDGRALAGLAAIVMRGGEIAYENAVGTQDFARNLPLRLDSRARIASVSKTFATIAAMQLKDAGKLDLDADAGEYLGFALRNPRTGICPRAKFLSHPPAHSACTGRTSWQRPA